MAEVLKILQRVCELREENSDLSPGNFLKLVVEKLRDGKDYNPTLEIDVLDRVSESIDSHISLGIKSFAPMEVTPGMMRGYDFFDPERIEYEGALIGPARLVRGVLSAMGFKWKVIRGNKDNPEKFWLVIYL